MAGSPGGIPLLQYADNTTFFIQGSESAAQSLAIMMEIFSDFSELQLNRAKSTFVGFGLSTSELTQCVSILGMAIGTLPIRYLGLPLTERSLRAPDWQPVLEKVEARLGGWQARLISRGGRLILLKAVLSAIPICFMSVFRMLVAVRRPLEGVMRLFFWWGSNLATTRGGALVAWSMVCRPISQGGLGIRHIQHTNAALLAKRVLQVMQPSGDILSLLLRQVYGHSID